MLAFGPVAFESVSRVYPAKLGEAFFRGTSRDGRFLGSFFFSGDLSLKIGFSRLRQAKL